MLRLLILRRDVAPLRMRFTAAGQKLANMFLHSQPRIRSCCALELHRELLLLVMIPFRLFQFQPKFCPFAELASAPICLETYPTFRQQIRDLSMRILSGSRNLRIPCLLENCWGIVSRNETRFKKRNRINVLECRVHKTLLKHCAKNHPNNRILSLLDSRVTLGATSEGRSSSRAICRVLQGSLGYVLGGCLYPGGFHIASGKNRSDAPSRNRPVPAPTKGIPTWLSDLRSGGFDRFDRILESAKCTKLAARWLRFLLLLAGDIEGNPGPGFQTRPRTPRGQLSMDVGFATATSKRMQLCLDEFATWLFAEFALTLQSIGWDYTAGPLALRAYGLHLFAGGFPRYKFVYTIAAMQDTFPHLRPFFSSAWQVDRKWQQYEPDHCRPVLSAPIMQAVSCLCLIWKWYRWLGITLIGFLGMLHPAEFISFFRSDLLLPGDTLNKTAAFYVHIGNPKTARFARKQHCTSLHMWLRCLVLLLLMHLYLLVARRLIDGVGTTSLADLEFQFLCLLAGPLLPCARKWCNSVVPWKWGP